MTEKFVSILMGSDSDLPVVEPAFKILEEFQISYEVKITSAHRTPLVTTKYVKDAEERGCSVFICAAGMAAHLAGAVAAATLKPVIGIPIKNIPNPCVKSIFIFLNLHLQILTRYLVLRQ